MKIKRRYTIEDAKKGLLPLNYEGHKIIEVICFSNDTEYPIIVLTEDKEKFSFNKDGYYISSLYDKQLEIEEEISLDEYVKSIWDEYNNEKNKVEFVHYMPTVFLKWYIENKQGEFIKKS